MLFLSDEDDLPQYDKYVIMEKGTAPTEDESKKESLAAKMPPSPSRQEQNNNEKVHTIFRFLYWL